MLDTQVRWLPVEQIAPNPHQPRREFAPGPLAELAESIRRHGIIQPLSVRRRDDGWELIAGERRLRAAKLAGLQTVPCLEMQVDKQDSAILALIENIQRRDLHYLEEATAIAAYLRQSGSTQEEAAALLGRSPSALANKLRLLRLSPDCCRLLTEHDLTERHARALLRLEDEEERLNALHHIIRQHLNVAQTEQYIDKRLAQLQTTPPPAAGSFFSRTSAYFSTVWTGACGWYGRPASAQNPAGRTRRTPSSSLSASPRTAGSADVYSPFQKTETSVSAFWFFRKPQPATYAKSQNYSTLLPDCNTFFQKRVI